LKRWTFYFHNIHKTKNCDMYSFGLNISGHLGAMRCIDFVCSWLAFLWWWQHIASATPNPIAARPTFPKCLADHPTSPTTAGNVLTAIPIRKMDACVSPEDVSNTRNNSVSSTVCVCLVYKYVVMYNTTSKCRKMTQNRVSWAY